MYFNFGNLVGSAKKELFTNTYNYHTTMGPVILLIRLSESSYTKALLALLDSSRGQMYVACLQPALALE